MRVCPYCLQCFSTKQRLVSHLTKNKKCYDVEKIGLPPVLLELMGFGSNKTNNESDVGNQKKNPIRASENKSKIIENQTSNKDNETTRAKEKKITQFQCSNCYRYFISEKNLERHTSMNKCPKFKNGTQSEEQSNKLITRVVRVTEVNTPTINDDENNNQSTEKNENDKIKESESAMYKPKNSQKSDLLLNRNLKNRNNTINISEKIENQKCNIKYIIKEDYINYLVTIMGSKDAALKYIKGCIQAKLRGDINLLYKIYFENRETHYYPIEVLDAKGKKLYYKMPDNIILDENGSTVKSILVENLQNCYLKFCNHIIDSNIENNDVLFNDYDLNDIQKHVLELSDDKIKDKLLVGLIELIKK